MLHSFPGMCDTSGPSVSLGERKENTGGQLQPGLLPKGKVAAGLLPMFSYLERKMWVVLEDP